MAVLTIKTNSAPYGEESFYTCMRFALAALAEGHRVRIFFLEDAVLGAKKGQDTPEFPGLLDGKMPNVEELLKSALRQGAEIRVCGVCCRQRALAQEELVEGCRIGSMKELVSWVAASDKVVEF